MQVPFSEGTEVKVKNAMGRVLTSDLSTQGLNRLIRQLKDFRDDLDIIADEIVNKLAERGIRVAEYSVYSDWRDLIEFRYEPMNLGEGELVGESITLIHRVWYTSSKASIQNEKEAYVSPLLMSEYGAGWYALNGHRGTFPGQRHAFESEWFWYDRNGKKHSSEEDYHMIATQPMYKALIDMIQNVQAVAKEVFDSYEFG